MKRVLGLVLVAGCYIGSHGSLGTAVRKGPDATTSANGAIDLGTVATDEHQSGELLISFGLSPLTARDPTASHAPRMPVVMWGGRYERAFDVDKPEWRWFARMLLGGSMCGLDTSSSSMMTMAKPDPSCAGLAKMRDIGELETALGVALTVTTPPDHETFEPAVATVGLAIVYTYATDAALGTADFVGLELSLGIGGDVISPLASKH